MRRNLVIWCLLVALVGSLSCRAKDKESPPEAASRLTWLTSFDDAKAAAAARHVPILVNFSGSDWCMWCIRLDKEVLTQPAFQAYAETNLVLLSVDYPRSTPQSDDLRKRNEALGAQFKIEGLPTVLLLDASGRELARTGYQPGGAEAYVAHLRALLKQ